MAKKFDKELFDQHDKPARLAILHHLNAWTNNEDRYGADLVHPDGLVAEVEVRPNWHGTEFPWPLVNLPLRKAKYIQANITFWILNADHTHAVVLYPEQLTDDRIHKVWNKYQRAGDEEFYRVPLEECKIVALRRPTNVDSEPLTWSPTEIAG